MSTSANRVGVAPACLSFLAIYNPSLSTSEETLHDQILYYYTKADGDRKGRSVSNVDIEQGNIEKNERLRQIGLAQGMVEFAKGFSDGHAVDSIDTEKSRIILHELEAGWWILASIDLTRITSTSDSEQEHLTTEYSGREVASTALLLQQVLRAHRTFLLHHGANLAELYIRMTRSKLCNVLKRYWNRFINIWDVLLHGNPAIGLFNALKLAAGGELGVGVGEEEWGSGEREVLEAFIGRTEGLVDMTVSRFGDAPTVETSKQNTITVTGSGSPAAPTAFWQADGQHPRPSDGIVFSGIGAISRTSVRDISCWAEDIFRYGQDTYGVRDNPTSTRWRRRGGASSGVKYPRHQEKTRRDQVESSNKQNNRSHSAAESIQRSPNGHGIPRSIVGKTRVASPTAPSEPPGTAAVHQEPNPDKAGDALEGEETGTETVIKYLTLGVYGSKWGTPFRRPPQNPTVSKLRERHKARSSSPGQESLDSHSMSLADEMPGYFLIGYRGELNSSVEDDERDDETGEERDDRISDVDQKNRTLLRTLYVRRLRRKFLEGSSSSEIQDTKEPAFEESYSDRLRVVVYVHEPLIFVCLFELHTDALAIPAFYRSIHHQLGPLQRPLLTSTSPDKASAKLWEASLPKSTASSRSSQPIGDLVFDPTKLTIHTTLPNIPEPGTSASDRNGGDNAPWSRIEALSVYSQILSTYESTRRRGSELERTCKTSRGWWVVWMRLPEPTEPTNSEVSREAFLIRKASDYTAPKPRNVSGRFGRDVSAPASSWGPGKLAEGIGIDTRQYIEGLLTLNR